MYVTLRCSSTARPTTYALAVLLINMRAIVQAQVFPAAFYCNHRAGDIFILRSVDVDTARHVHLITAKRLNLATGLAVQILAGSA